MVLDSSTLKIWFFKTLHYSRKFKWMYLVKRYARTFSEIYATSCRSRSIHWLVSRTWWSAVNYIPCLACFLSYNWLKSMFFCWNKSASWTLYYSRQQYHVKSLAYCAPDVIYMGSLERQNVIHTILVFLFWNRNVGWSVFYWFTN